MVRAANNLPVVIIRLDDIQAWYCETLSEVVIDNVVSTQTPISVGIIGRYLDEDTDITSYLKSIASNPLVEIASHSYSHTPYGGQSVAWQEDDLEASLNMIEKVTSVVPLSFIPPQNSYDENTAVVEVEYSMSIMSAQCTWDLALSNTTISCGVGSKVVAPNIIWNGIAMLPAGAVLGDVHYWEDFSGPASVDDAVAWIDAQILGQGFSVLMLHPQEFATDESTCDTLDQSKLNVLLDLIAYGKDKWQFMTFQNAASYFESQTSSKY